jgi:SOS-response transcriptional repressor LexA
MRGLTTRQAAVLALVRESIQRRGFPPTLRELGEALGIRSNGVNDHLRALVRKGFLHREDRKSRGLRLAAPQDSARVSDEDLDQAERAVEGLAEGPRALVLRALGELRTLRAAHRGGAERLA